MKKVVCLLLMSFVSRTSFAQDIHFSQFFTNPIILSPAATGFFDGNYRLGFNYKSQDPWAIGNQIYNYHSESAFVDFSFGEQKLKHDFIGIGLNFLNDKAGDGRLGYQRGGLTVAYHKGFDRQHRYYLSAGFGFDYINRSVEFEKFYFHNQWVADEGFNTSLYSGEAISGQRFSMVDLSAGLNFSGKLTNKLLLNIGGSLLHINRPKSSFYNQNSRLGFRYVVTINLDYEANEQLVLHTNAYYTFQDKASEAMLGLMLGVKPFNGGKDGKSTFYLGCYYRIGDALAPLVGYQYKKTRLLLNYDVLLSTLSRPSKLNGGLELSLVHIGSFPKGIHPQKLNCPKF